MSAALTRRALFARFRGGPQQVRPPWSRPEEQFTERCTLCNKCAVACPVGIITKGHAGYPIVVLATAGCTFCGACADACEVGCFDRAQGRRPWDLKASISAACVETKGVACRMCEAACETSAIRFRPRLGGGSTPSVEHSGCTGCGACIAPCPVKAITVASPALLEATA